MSATQWRFTDASGRVASRINEQGMLESCIVEALADWLAEDPANSIAPYVAPLEDYLAQVDAMRDARINAGIEWSGIPFDSDERSRANLTGVVAAVNAGIPLPAGFAWRNAANVDVPMTAVDLVGFAGAMLAHVNGCYAASFALKDALEQASDPSTVDLTAGWPA